MLFRKSSKIVKKVNLLVVLTPYVIRDAADMRRIFPRKLDERREFVRLFTEARTRQLSAIDYQRKRGLLAEINRFGAEVEAEPKPEAKAATSPR